MQLSSPPEGNVTEQQAPIDGDQNLYVIMIHSQLRVIGDENVRYPVDGPETFGIGRGYWSTRYVPDRLGTSRPDGIDIVIEVYGSDHQDAEDNALSAARQIGDLVGFYAGSNESSEIFVKTAKVTNEGHLVEQRDYVYLDEEHQFDRNYLSPGNIRRMLGQIPLLEQSVKNDIQRGLRWYSKAVSSDDGTDKYLASWIGFEAIGPYLCGSFGLPRGGLKRFCQNSASGTE